MSRSARAADFFALLSLLVYNIEINQLEDESGLGRLDRLPESKGLDDGGWLCAKSECVGAKERLSNSFEWSIEICPA